ncbi:hypothetical protein [Mesorhizobium argentiipisi]|uniref:Uncharacterized protein n=1 Tax=Mesorhizobium argentiipisi TaxID=3015175 RepID=A0ABU8KB41_9HYPH
MSKIAIVAMTIIGCDCDVNLCEYIGETPPKWSTIAECQTAMKSQILQEHNFDYPVVSGICHTKDWSPASKLAATGSRPELKPASPTIQPERALPPELRHRTSVPIGSPTTALEAAAARPVAYEQVVDGGTGVLYRTKNGYAVVKTNLGRAVSAIAETAKRSANWLAGLIPTGL